MPDGTVTPLRPRAPAGYTDTAALNDIHTLLTSTDPGDGTLADIADDPGPHRPPDDPGPGHRDQHHRDRARLAGRLRRRRGHRRVRPADPCRGRAGDRDLHQDRRRAGLPWPSPSTAAPCTQAGHPRSRPPDHQPPGGLTCLASAAHHATALPSERTQPAMTTSDRRYPRRPCRGAAARRRARSRCGTGRGAERARNRRTAAR